MAMKHYPPEFKADTVALYRSRPGVTIAQVAADLGVNAETLRNWIRIDDVVGEGDRGRGPPSGGRGGVGASPPLSPWDASSVASVVYAPRNGLPLHHLIVQLDRQRWVGA
ncbi:transposase [Micromonospora sp. NPDC003776]